MIRGVVAVTDLGWLESLMRSKAKEANFWQPRPTRVREREGTPWIFKIRGSNRVAGFGFFAHWAPLPMTMAWDTFAAANGSTTFEEMRSKVQSLRRGAIVDDVIGCIVLEDVTILPEPLRPLAPVDWHPNIVRHSGYDLSEGEGARVWSDLAIAARQTDQVSPMLSVAGGYFEPSLTLRRRGQGAFRLMVTDAYERRCAITGERTLPVLEAAHIRPFSSEQKHDIRNGLLMRSDLHRLYDRGLVTVDANLIIHVSSAINRDYSNGKIYYALQGGMLRPPAHDNAAPDRDALEWHAKNVFQP